MMPATIGKFITDTRSPFLASFLFIQTCASVSLIFIATEPRIRLWAQPERLLMVAIVNKKIDVFNLCSFFLLNVKI